MNIFNLSAVQAVAISPFFIVFYSLLIMCVLYILKKHTILKITSVASVIMAALYAPIAMTLVVHDQNPTYVKFLNFLSFSGVELYWDAYVDSLSVTMVFMVTIVSVAIYVYSLQYIKKEELSRFLIYLNLFITFMLLLVTAGNYVQLFLGWEGVSLCSYLLIGFWYKDEKNVRSAQKAFLVNRVADVPLLIAISMIFSIFDSLDFNVIFNTKKEIPNILGFLLLFGSMAKSATLGLHLWLPAAMRGPTPVSALIHAATMVVAGVFLLVRSATLLELNIYVKEVTMFLGIITSLYAGIVANLQHDIKKIIAYSTCSQLGYMLAAVGAGGYRAGIFHLLTHAFFKANLFLMVGYIIVYLKEQDIRKMSWFKRKLDWLYISFILVSLALVGIFPMSGYYSKDMILNVLLNSSSKYSSIIYSIGIIASLVTGSYISRLILHVFHMKKTDVTIKMNSKYMTIAIIFLLPFSLFSGFIFKFFGIDMKEFWYEVPVLYNENLKNLSNNQLLHYLPMIAGIVGALSYYIIFIYKLSYKKMGTLKEIIREERYFCYLYSSIISFVKSLSLIFYKIETLVFDSIVEKSTNTTAYMSEKINKVHTGILYNYIYTMLVAVLIISIYIVL